MISWWLVLLVEVTEVHKLMLSMSDWFIHSQMIVNKMVYSFAVLFIVVNSNTAQAMCTQCNIM
jgi:hypothetical protein